MESNGVNKLVASEFRGSVFGAIIGELIVAVVWGLLSRVIHDGSIILAVVNIGLLLFSLVMASTLFSILKMRLPGFVSLFISVVLWVLIFGVFRGLF